MEEDAGVPPEHQEHFVPQSQQSHEQEPYHEQEPHHEQELHHEESMPPPTKKRFGFRNRKTSTPKEPKEPKEKKKGFLDRLDSFIGRVIQPAPPRQSLDELPRRPRSASPTLTHAGTEGSLRYHPGPRRGRSASPVGSSSQRSREPSFHQFAARTASHAKQSSRAPSFNQFADQRSRTASFADSRDSRNEPSFHEFGGDPSYHPSVHSQRGTSIPPELRGRSPSLEYHPSQQAAPTSVSRHSSRRQRPRANSVAAGDSQYHPAQHYREGMPNYYPHTERRHRLYVDQVLHGRDTRQYEPIRSQSVKRPNPGNAPAHSVGFAPTHNTGNAPSRQPGHSRSRTHDDARPGNGQPPPPPQKTAKTSRAMPTSQTHVKRKPIEPAPDGSRDAQKSTCIDPPDKPLEMFSKAVLNEILRQLKGKAHGKGGDRDRGLGLGFDLAKTFQYSLCTGKKKAVCVSFSQKSLV